MTDDPPAVARLDGLLAATRIAHEAIYDLHAELRIRSRASERVGELLAESARITLTQMPEVTAEARRLAKVWREQSVLDPDGAASTLHALRAELDRIETGVGQRIERQREIARDLQSLRG